MPAQATGAAMTRITAHQLDVLYRRWQLGSDEAVAQDMGVSRNTVRNALYTVRLMLDAADTTQATYILRADLMALANRAQVRVTERRRPEVLRKRSVSGGAK